MRYCESPFNFHRRKTREIVIGDPQNGGVIMGGDHPVVRQSMITCGTMDTAASVQQTLDLVNVGCQIVRITAPTVKDAAISRTSSRNCAGAGAMCRLWRTFISNRKPPWRR